MTTNFGCELILTDFLNAIERFKHQIELQRASIAEVAAHQREVEEGIAQKKAELAVAIADLAKAQARHEALHKEITKWSKQLEGTAA
jgi:septal ring factor EnvC (AmiA/AmiB activator)